MYADTVGRMLQVRNLPDDVHAKLKARAAAARMSLSDYVARELERLVQYRSNAEILEGARRRGPKISREDVMRAIYEGRDEGDPGWDVGLPPREF